MAHIEIVSGILAVQVDGVDRILALKNRVEIPFEHVLGAEVDPEAARGWWKGWRMPGTFVPGLIVAGSFYQNGEWTFFDVHDPDQTVVIALAEERYSRLVVQVDDPERAVAEINHAVQERQTG